MPTCLGTRKATAKELHGPWLQRTHRGRRPWHVNRAEPGTREIRCAPPVRGRAVQPAHREEARWRIGSRMPPYERGRGVTPAEQRGARTITDSMATPATRRGGHAATTGIESTARRASIPSGDRLYEEACAGKPPAGFCEGETHNGAWSNTVTLPTPKGGSNREHKADLHIGGVLPTRPHGPFTIDSQGFSSLPSASGSW